MAATETRAAGQRPGGGGRRRRRPRRSATMPRRDPRDALLGLVRAAARRASRSRSPSSSARSRSGSPAARSGTTTSGSGGQAGGARRGVGRALGVLGIALACDGARRRSRLRPPDLPRRALRSGNCPGTVLAPAAGCVSTLAPLMFEIGSSLREARTAAGPRLRGDGGAHEGAREVPAAPRGRAVRPASRAHVHEGLPAASTRTRSGSTAGSTSTSTTRATSPATRRERQPRLPRSPSPQPPAAARAARVAHGRGRARRDPRRHGARDRRLALRRPRRPAGRGDQRRAASVAATSGAKATQRQVTLSVRAVRGPSFMEVRAGTAASKPLYTGTLERGQFQRFTRKSLYLAVDTSRQRRRQGQRAARRASARLRAEGHQDHGRVRVSRPRAAIVVTGSELVRGERTDRNGPFYAREALSLGLVPGRIAIVGDDPDDLEAALRAASAAPTSASSRAGSGRPTTTARSSSSRASRAPRSGSTTELERQIEGVSRSVAERLGRPYADFAAGVTKQATVPEGAVVIGIAGTAPGLVLDGERVRLRRAPGPAGRAAAALARGRRERAACSAVLARTSPPGRRVLRFFGASESAVARALAEAGGDGDGVEATICARDFEIHVDLVVEPGAEERADELAAALRAPLERYLFSEDERTVAEIVLELCRERGLRLATAESCTGGLVAARLTDIPGASDVVRGRRRRLRERREGRRSSACPRQLIAAHGAVSAEVAAAMAAGVRGAARRRRRDRGDGRGRAGRRHRGEAGRPRLPPRLGARGTSEATSSRFPGDRAAIRTRADRRGAPPRPAPSDTESARSRVTPAASVGGDDRLRLFLALQLPADVLDVVERLAGDGISSGVGVVPREHLHVTLAFLGARPGRELPAIVDALRDAASTASASSRSSPSRWRETRSVGMVVLDDPTGERDRARRAAPRAARGARRLPAGGAPVAPAPHRAALPGAPAARPAAARRREHSFRPVLLLTYLDCTRPEPGTRCSNASR